MRNRTVLKLFGIIAPIFTYLVNLLIPGRRAAVAAAECRNKSKIMALVQNMESYMDAEGKTPLQSIVERCYALGPFPALWAVEGAGKDLAEWHMARNEQPTRLLIDAQLDPKWDKALLMLHAGMGLGFAKYLTERQPKSATDAQVRDLVTRVVELNRRNSRPGYFGAAMESLGLVSRFLRDARYCKQVHRALVAHAPDAVGYFWRGVGRCLYFHPLNFLPGFKRPMRAIDLCEAEAPDPILKQTMLAGVAWPLTIVNMTDPAVMEYALEHDRDYFAGSPAFENGVMSSIVMRYDTTPDDPLIPQFMNHRPAPALAEAWKTKIQDSFETAIQRVYPALKANQCLDKVFQYQPLPELVAALPGRSTIANA